MAQKSNTYNIGQEVSVKEDRIHLIDVRERDKPSKFDSFVITDIQRADGTIFYEIEGQRNRYKIVEEALIPLPDTESTHESGASFRYLGDEIDLGNLNITLDPLDDEMMKKFDNLAEKRIKHLEEDVRKEIRDIVLRVLEEKELI